MKWRWIIGFVLGIASATVTPVFANFIEPLPVTFAQVGSTFPYFCAHSTFNDDLTTIGTTVLSNTPGCTIGANSLYAYEYAFIPNGQLLRFSAPTVGNFVPFPGTTSPAFRIPFSSTSIGAPFFDNDIFTLDWSGGVGCPPSCGTFNTSLNGIVSSSPPIEVEATLTGFLPQTFLPVTTNELTLVPAPEPESLVILFVGLLGLLAIGATRNLKKKIRVALGGIGILAVCAVASTPSVAEATFLQSTFVTSQQLGSAFPFVCSAHGGFELGGTVLSSVSSCAPGPGTLFAYEYRVAPGGGVAINTVSLPFGGVSPFPGTNAPVYTELNLGQGAAADLSNGILTLGFAGCIQPCGIVNQGGVGVVSDLPPVLVTATVTGVTFDPSCVGCGFGSPTTFQAGVPAAAPEPDSVALLSVGVFGLMGAGVTRRLNRKRH